MNPAALLLSFSLLSAVNAQIVPAGEPPAPAAAAESREPDSGIQVSPPEPDSGIPATRRETRAAQGAAPATRRETRAAQRAAPETRRETRNPKPESRRPGCPAPCLATVTLVDGSVLHGTLRPRFLPAVAPAVGLIRIDLCTVERIDFIPSDSPAGPSAGGARSGRREGARGAAEPGRGATSPSRIAFRNGDTLTAALSSKHDRFVLETLLGPLRIPLSTVRSISFNPSTSSTPSTSHLSPLTSHLLYYCTFDSPESIFRPAAGPAGRLLGGSFVPGRKGNALRTFADQPAAEVDFEPGILGPRGTIEFWAKREEQPAFAAREGNLRFFGLWLHERGETPPWCSTHMQFTSNDGMGMSGLCGMVNHCSWATNPFFGHGAYDAIQDDPFGWHHYAVAWDADGLPETKAPDGGPAVVAVYLDGKPLSTQGRQTIAFGAKHLKAIPGRFAKLAFPTPSNGWGSSGGHVPFLIDEFKIWSAPQTEFSR